MTDVLAQSNNWQKVLPKKRKKLLIFFEIVENCKPLGYY
jgi:hypothetical protein